MFRSDHMAFCDIYLQPEAAFEILSQLGEISCVQFLDLNPDAQLFQRTYVMEVTRCAEMERKLHYIEMEMKKDNIYMPELEREPKAMQPSEMTMFENIFDKWESDIAQMSEYHVSLMKNYLEMNEMYYMLSNIGPMLGDAELTESWFFNNKNWGRSIFVGCHADTFRDWIGTIAVSIPAAKLCGGTIACYFISMHRNFIEIIRPLIYYIILKITGEGVGLIGPSGRLVIMTGVVRRSKCFHFEMMLWRISRGNIYYRQASRDTILQDPYTGQEIRKVAFLAICQGEQLAARMQKVINGFGVNTYPCPQTQNERSIMIQTLDLRLCDLEDVLSQTKVHRCKALRAVGKQWRGWVVQVRKAKAIYHTMNKFNMDITKKCLIGQCWVPALDVKRIQDILEYCTQVIDTNVPSFMYKTGTTSMPPTYYRTNKFTHGFQALIKAYGDSTYREINPGLYTIVTFPFLFAVMFGDVGHSIIIISIAAWMVGNEKKYVGKTSYNDLWNIIFGGRYVLLLLGVFGVFTGFIYNDWFGKGVVLMHSYWINTYTDVDLAQAPLLEMSVPESLTSPYIFGVDPLWELAKNKVIFENSLKMKLSVIFGVIHMMFGLILSVFNHVYFKRYYKIYLSFIPKFLFLSCLFFWLVILIYIKWFKYNPRGNVKLSSNCAPQVMILFIDMFLFIKSKPAGVECDAYIFPSQQLVQVILITIALLCIPVLLFGNPIYVYYHNKKMREEIMSKRTNFRRYQHRESDKMSMEIQAEIAKYMVPFHDLFIVEGVRTIEFVLGTISHTASYLRLWALSIAHTQLTNMLWKLLLSHLGFRHHSILGCILLVIVFAIWATFTITILVVMEGLSAFLHTLRLHWVEFMSKFYEAEGIPFRPFCFKNILATEHEKCEIAAFRKGRRANKAKHAHVL